MPGKIVLSMLSAVALAYAALCAFMFVAQRSMLYFPVPGGRPPGAEILSVPSGGETLRLCARPDKVHGALIYFGGNAEDVSGNFESFAAALPDVALYFVNYRGYGGSSGSPSEAALLADALAVYDWVHARHAQISVAGRSLGSGVAVYLAQARPVERLVLVTPYDSIENVARGHYPWLPVALLLKDRFDSASRIAQVRAKTLAIVAERDEVIPRERSEALVAKFPAGQIRVEVIPGATHNTLDESPAYLESIREFLGLRRAV